MFDLNDDRLRQYMYALENQKQHYVVDLRTGALRREDRLPQAERPDPDAADPAAAFVALPRWSSADGYQLMESFVTTVENLELQTELRNILASGVSVFRRFKEAVKVYPVVESRWNRFKRDRHGESIVAWYNRLREVAGLEAIEIGVDEEIDDLVRQDFAIRTVSVADTHAPSEIAAYDEAMARELTSSLPEAVASYLREERKRFIAALTGDTIRKLIAVSPREEECGIAWLVDTGDGGSVSYFTVPIFYVFPAFRGLGIGGALADAIIHSIGTDGSLIVEAAGDAPAIRRRFERELGERLVWNCWYPLRGQSGELSS